MDELIPSTADRGLRDISVTSDWDPSGGDSKETGHHEPGASGRGHGALSATGRSIGRRQGIGALGRRTRNIATLDLDRLGRGFVLRVVDRYATADLIVRSFPDRAAQAEGASEAARDHLSEHQPEPRDPTSPELFYLAERGDGTRRPAEPADLATNSESAIVSPDRAQTGNDVPSAPAESTGWTGLGSAGTSAGPARGRRPLAPQPSVDIPSGKTPSATGTETMAEASGAPRTNRSTPGVTEPESVTAGSATVSETDAPDPSSVATSPSPTATAVPWRPRTPATNRRVRVETLDTGQRVRRTVRTTSAAAAGADPRLATVGESGAKPADRRDAGGRGWGAEDATSDVDGGRTGLQTATESGGPGSDGVRFPSPQNERSAPSARTRPAQNVTDSRRRDSGGSEDERSALPVNRHTAAPAESSSRLSADASPDVAPSTSGPSPTESGRGTDFAADLASRVRDRTGETASPGPSRTSARTSRGRGHPAVLVDQSHSRSAVVDSATVSGGSTVARRSGAPDRASRVVSSVDDATAVGAPSAVSAESGSADSSGRTRPDPAVPRSSSGRVRSVGGASTVLGQPDSPRRDSEPRQGPEPQQTVTPARSGTDVLGGQAASPDALAVRPPSMLGLGPTGVSSALHSRPTGVSATPGREPAVTAPDTEGGSRLPSIRPTQSGTAVSSPNGERVGRTAVPAPTSGRQTARRSPAATGFEGDRDAGATVARQRLRVPDQAPVAARPQTDVPGGDNRHGPAGRDPNAASELVARGDDPAARPDQPRARHSNRSPALADRRSREPAPTVGRKPDSATTGTETGGDPRPDGMNAGASTTDGPADARSRPRSNGSPWPSSHVHSRLTTYVVSSRTVANVTRHAAFRGTTSSTTSVAATTGGRRVPANDGTAGAPRTAPTRALSDTDPGSDDPAATGNTESRAETRLDPGRPLALALQSEPPGPARAGEHGPIDRSRESRGAREPVATAAGSARTARDPFRDATARQPGTDATTHAVTTDGERTQSVSEPTRRAPVTASVVTASRPPTRARRSRSPTGVFRPNAGSRSIPSPEADRDARHGERDGTLTAVAHGGAGVTGWVPDSARRRSPGRRRSVGSTPEPDGPEGDRGGSDRAGDGPATRLGVIRTTVAARSQPASTRERAETSLGPEPSHASRSIATTVSPGDPAGVRTGSDGSTRLESTVAQREWSSGPSGDRDRSGRNGDRSSTAEARERAIRTPRSSRSHAQSDSADSGSSTDRGSAADPSDRGAVTESRPEGPAGRADHDRSPARTTAASAATESTTRIGKYKVNRRESNLDTASSGETDAGGPSLTYRSALPADVDGRRQRSGVEERSTPAVTDSESGTGGSGPAGVGADRRGTRPSAGPTPARADESTEVGETRNMEQTRRHQRRPAEERPSRARSTDRPGVTGAGPEGHRARDGPSPADGTPASHVTGHEGGQRREDSRTDRRQRDGDVPFPDDSFRYEADVDRLVDRLYRKLERKQRIERERRGGR